MAPGRVEVPTTPLQQTRRSFRLKNSQSDHSRPPSLSSLSRWAHPCQQCSQQVRRAASERTGYLDVFPNWEISTTRRMLMGIPGKYLIETSGGRRRLNSRSRNGKRRQRCSRSSCCSPLGAFIPVLPFCHSEIRAARRQISRYPKELNTLGDHLRKRRMDRELLQRQVAALLGVHPLTISNWERNATTPPVSSFPAIIEFLGYNPSPQRNLQEQLLAKRRSLGLS